MSTFEHLSSLLFPRGIVCKRDTGERISVKKGQVFEAKKSRKHPVFINDYFLQIKDSFLIISDYTTPNFSFTNWACDEAVKCCVIQILE